MFVAKPKVGGIFDRYCHQCNGTFKTVAQDCPKVTRTLKSAAAVRKSTKAGTVSHKDVITAEDILVHKRLYSAVLLHHLTFVTDLRHTAKEFRVDHRVLEQLRHQAYSFAGE